MKYVGELQGRGVLFARHWYIGIDNQLALDRRLVRDRIGDVHVTSTWLSRRARVPITTDDLVSGAVDPPWRVILRFESELGHDEIADVLQELGDRGIGDTIDGERTGQYTLRWVNIDDR